jgi:hypothetical protein
MREGSHKLCEKETRIGALRLKFGELGNSADLSVKTQLLCRYHRITGHWFISTVYVSCKSGIIPLAPEEQR